MNKIYAFTNINLIIEKIRRIFVPIILENYKIPIII